MCDHLEQEITREREPCQKTERWGGGRGGIHTAAEIKIDRVEERKMYNRKKRKPVQSQALTL